ncbi:MAG: hypothetical protein JNJ45_04345 [Chthonomonas sp.]|nr:hypothetical protein [Chthonomonas sp.]
MKKFAVIGLALAAHFALAGDPPSVQIAKRAVEDEISRREGRGYDVVFTKANKRDAGRDRVDVTGAGYIVRRGEDRRNFTFDVSVDTYRQRALSTRYDLDREQIGWSEQQSREAVEDRVIADIRRKHGNNTRITFRKSSLRRDRDQDISTGNGTFQLGKELRDFDFTATVDNTRGRISRYDLNLGREQPDRPKPPTPPIIKSPEDAAREAVRARIARDFGNQYDLRFWQPSRKDAGNLLYEVTGEAEVTSAGGTRRKFKFRCLVNKKDYVVSETTINYDN